MRRMIVLGVVALTAYGFAAMGCGGSSGSSGNGGNGSGGSGSGGSASGGTSSTPTGSGGVAGGNGGSVAGGSAAGGSAAGGSSGTSAGSCSTTNGDYEENTTFADEGKTDPYKVNKWGTWGNDTEPTLTQTTEGPEGLDCSSGCAALTIDFSNGTAQYSAGQIVEYFGTAADSVENLLNQTITLKVALSIKKADGATADVPISINLIGQDTYESTSGVDNVWNYNLGTAAALDAADGWHAASYKVVDKKVPSWSPTRTVCASALHNIGITIQNDKAIDDTNGAVVTLYVQSIAVGSGSGGGTGGSGGSGGSGGGGGSGGAGGTGGGGSGGSTASCDDVKDVTPCGGEVVGTWTVKPSCLKVSGELDVTNLGIGCTSMGITGTRQVSGKWTATSDGKYKDETTTKGEEEIAMDAKCLEVSGTTTTCENIGAVLQTSGYASIECVDAADGGCTCTATIDQKAGIGFLAFEPPTDGKYTTADNVVTADEEREYSYCVSDKEMSWTPKSTSPTLTGTILFQNDSGGTSCTNVEPCGGDVVGTWDVSSSCLEVSGELDVTNLGIGCTTMGISGSRQVSGKWTATSDGKYTDETTTKGEEEITMPPSCLEVSGTTTTCENIGAVLQTSGYASIECADAADGGCTCKATIDQKAGIGLLSFEPPTSGKYASADNVVTTDEEREYSYCVSDSEMSWTPKTTSPTLTGTIDLKKQ